MPYLLYLVPCFVTPPPITDRGMLNGETAADIAVGGVGVGGCHDTGSGGPCPVPGSVLALPRLMSRVTASGRDRAAAVTIKAANHAQLPPPLPPAAVLTIDGRTVALSSPLRRRSVSSADQL